MRIARVLACLALGCVLLLSGALKSIDAAAPVRATAAYHLVPAWLALGVGAVLPALEVVLGAALLTGWRRQAAGVLAVGLGAVFAAANAAALARGLIVDCGCFGGLLGAAPATALALDAVVIALGAAAVTGEPAAPAGYDHAR